MHIFVQASWQRKQRKEEMNARHQNIILQGTVLWFSRGCSCWAHSKPLSQELPFLSMPFVSSELLWGKTAFCFVPVRVDGLVGKQIMNYDSGTWLL